MRCPKCKTTIATATVRETTGDGYRWVVLIGEDSNESLSVGAWHETREEAEADANRILDEHAGEPGGFTVFVCHQIAHGEIPEVQS